MKRRERPEACAAGKGAREDLKDCKDCKDDNDKNDKNR
jgi:hypothetical protein